MIVVVVDAVIIVVIIVVVIVIVIVIVIVVIISSPPEFKEGGEGLGSDDLEVGVGGVVRAHQRSHLINRVRDLCSKSKNINKKKEQKR